MFPIENFFIIKQTNAEIYTKAWGPREELLIRITWRNFRSKLHKRWRPVQWRQHGTDQWQACWWLDNTVSWEKNSHCNQKGEHEKPFRMRRSPAHIASSSKEGTWHPLHRPSTPSTLPGNHAPGARHGLLNQAHLQLPGILPLEGTIFHLLGGCLSHSRTSCTSLKGRGWEVGEAFQPSWVSVLSWHWKPPPLKAARGKRANKLLQMCGIGTNMDIQDSLPASPIRSLIP